MITCTIFLIKYKQLIIKQCLSRNMDLLTQLNRAMEYIEAHICDDIIPDDVSSVTNYSSYHFCRLFYYIAEMPLSEYIRKRKLTLAAMELQSSDIKVIDLSVKYGYDSADSFTRAFYKQHGITPTTAREKGIILKIYTPLSFHIKIKGVQEMNWRIEEKEAFEVFGIERIFKNDETHKVPDFWTECHKDGSYEKLFQAAKGIKGKKGICTINAICGYCEPLDDTFPYMLFALKNEDSKTEGFKTFYVPKCTWAVFRSEETDTIGQEIPKLFNRAYSEWLPSSGYEKAIGPDMELYGTVENGKYFEEVWIPVVKK